jgi:hypothetical protein
VLVVSWILEREYRQHRVLDAELPATYTKWLASLDQRLRQEADETNRRIIKVVIHPAEIETWARREGREVNERTRSDYAALTWRTADARRRAGREKRSSGVLAEAGRMMAAHRAPSRPDRWSSSDDLSELWQLATTLPIRRGLLFHSPLPD